MQGGRRGSARGGGVCQLAFRDGFLETCEQSCIEKDTGDDTYMDSRIEGLRTSLVTVRLRNKLNARRARMIGQRVSLSAETVYEIVNSSINVTCTYNETYASWSTRNCKYRCSGRYPLEFSSLLKAVRLYESPPSTTWSKIPFQTCCMWVILGRVYCADGGGWNIEPSVHMFGFLESGARRLEGVRVRQSQRSRRGESYIHPKPHVMHEWVPAMTVADLVRRQLSDGKELADPNCRARLSNLVL